MPQASLVGGGDEPGESVDQAAAERLPAGRGEGIDLVDHEPVEGSCAGEGLGDEPALLGRPEPALFAEGDRPGRRDAAAPGFERGVPLTASRAAADQVGNRSERAGGQMVFQVDVASFEMNEVDGTAGSLAEQPGTAIGKPLGQGESVGGKEQRFPVGPDGPPDTIVGAAKDGRCRGGFHRRRERKEASAGRPDGRGETQGLGRAGASTTLPEERRADKLISRDGSRGEFSSAGTEACWTSDGEVGYHDRSEVEGDKVAFEVRLSLVGLTFGFGWPILTVAGARRPNHPPSLWGSHRSHVLLSG